MCKLFSLVFLSGFALAQTATVTLTVLPSPTAGVTKYNLYRSTTPGQYSSPLKSLTAPVLSTTDLIPQTATEQTFYYVARAVSPDGKSESVNTAEKKVTIEAFITPPVELKCTIQISGKQVTGVCQ